MARWYCDQVVADAVPCCHWEWLACKRFLDMLDRAETDPHCPWVYAIEPVVDLCDLTEKLPHVKGFEGSIVLEPVQMWWLANIFGFRDRRTGLRWILEADLWVPRKNGKSILSACISIFHSGCEGEVGAETVICAGSEEQAHKVFGPIRAMTKMEPDLRLNWNISDTKEAITFNRTGATIQPITAIGKTNDGWNPSLVVAEELHAQKQEVIGVMQTAQGARRAPLFLSISTAGRDSDSPAYGKLKDCQKILEGKASAPRKFVALYMPDKEDETHLFDLTVIEKVNPLWDVSLNEGAIEKEVRVAKQSEADLAEYKRTRFNIWSRGGASLFNTESWDECGDITLDLDAFRGFPMYAGIDLASRNDLNSVTFMIEVDDCVYTVNKYWIGRAVPRLKDERYADKFIRWAKEGWITLTDMFEGTFADYRVIKREVLAMLEGHKVIGIALDDFQANYLASEFELAGHETFIVQKNARNLTPATDDLRSRSGNPRMFQHDGNPLTTWCAGNTVGYYDSNDNVLPKKEKKGSPAAIDGIDSMILANAIRLEHKAGVLGQNKKAKPVESPYLRRGLLGFDDGSRPA